MGSNVLDGVADGVLVTDVDLVEADVNAGLVAEVLSGLVSKLLLNIEDSNTSDADFTQRLGHVVSETTSTTGLVSIDRHRTLRG